MGDKSPKSINKHASQKQVRTDKSNRQKEQDTLARQATGKKA